MTLCFPLVSAKHRYMALLYPRVLILYRISLVIISNDTDIVFSDGCVAPQEAHIYGTMFPPCSCPAPHSSRHCSEKCRDCILCWWYRLAASTEGCHQVFLSFPLSTATLHCYNSNIMQALTIFRWRCEIALSTEAPHHVSSFLKFSTVIIARKYTWTLHRVFCSFLPQLECSLLLPKINPNPNERGLRKSCCLEWELTNSRCWTAETGS